MDTRRPDPIQNKLRPLLVLLVAALFVAGPAVAQNDPDDFTFSDEFGGLERTTGSGDIPAEVRDADQEARSRGSGDGDARGPSRTSRRRTGRRGTGEGNGEAREQAQEERTEEEPSYDRVDGGHQDGGRKARDALARYIGTTKGGYDTDVLLRASEGEIQALQAWFNQVSRIEEDFPKNTNRIKKELGDKDIADATLHDLYEYRTSATGWFDNQGDEDDYEVVTSFLQFVKDLPQPSPFLDAIRQKVGEMIVVAGPAYKVPVDPAQATDPEALAQLFKRDVDKGTFQFAASYLQSLMLDSKRLEIARELSRFGDGDFRALQVAARASEIDGGPTDVPEELRGYPELVTAARDTAAAQEALRRAMRELSILTRAFNRLSGGALTRERLFQYLVEGKDIDLNALDSALDRVARASAAVRASGTRAVSLARAARQTEATVQKHARFIGSVRKNFGDVPQGVELSDRLADHRSRIQRALGILEVDNVRKYLWRMRRQDPEKAAAFHNRLDRLARAVVYQNAAEQILAQLVARKAEVVAFAETVTFDDGAPAELTGAREQVQSALEAANPQTWGKALWDGATTAKALPEVGNRLMAELNQMQARLEQLKEAHEQWRADQARASQEQAEQAERQRAERGQAERGQADREQADREQAEDEGDRIVLNTGEEEVTESGEAEEEPYAEEAEAAPNETAGEDPVEKLWGLLSHTHQKLKEATPESGAIDAYLEVDFEGINEWRFQRHFVTVLTTRMREVNARSPGAIPASAFRTVNSWDDRWYSIGLFGNRKDAADAALRKLNYFLQSLDVVADRLFELK